MKRREFIRNISAFSTLPAVPSGVFAVPEVSPELYFKAEKLASLWVDTSANMMKHALNLDDKTAKSLFQSLLKNNIVSAPNKLGVARAIVPCYESPIYFEKVKALTEPTKPLSVTANSAHLEKRQGKLKKLKDVILKDAEINDDTVFEEEETSHE